jgi:hypothetical protein
VRDRVVRIQRDRCAVLFDGAVEIAAVLEHVTEIEAQRAVCGSHRDAMPQHCLGLFQAVQRVQQISRVVDRRRCVRTRADGGLVGAQGLMQFAKITQCIAEVVESRGEIRSPGAGVTVLLDRLSSASESDQYIAELIGGIGIALVHHASAPKQGFGLGMPALLEQRRAKIQGVADHYSFHPHKKCCVSAPAAVWEARSRKPGASLFMMNCHSLSYQEFYSRLDDSVGCHETDIIHRGVSALPAPVVYRPGEGRPSI